MSSHAQAQWNGAVYTEDINLVDSMLAADPALGQMALDVAKLRRRPAGTLQARSANN